MFQLLKSPEMKFLDKVYINWGRIKKKIYKYCLIVQNTLTFVQNYLIFVQKHSIFAQNQIKIVQKYVETYLLKKLLGSTGEKGLYRINISSVITDIK